MQAMAEHYRTMKGGFTYFKNIDPELKQSESKTAQEPKKQTQMWSSNVAKEEVK
jgi:hypothetical protein